MPAENNTTTDPNGGQQKEVEVKTPFDDIDTDLLDDAAIAKIGEAKAQFIKAQTDARNLQTELQQQKEVASRFQSEADKQRAELQRLQQPKADPYVEKAQAFLAARGASPEEIQKQAPFYADLFKESVLMAKAEIGADLGPLAGTVILHDANTQFTAARALNPEIMDDEVSQETWEFVQGCVNRGEQLTAQAISNYAKMVFVDKGKHKAQPNVPAPSFVNPAIAQKMNRSTNNSGKFTFPGAQIVPLGSGGNGEIPDAGRPLNEDTRNALQAVFGRLGQGTGIFPKAFTPASGGRPGHRSTI